MTDIKVIESIPMPGNVPGCLCHVQGVEWQKVNVCPVHGVKADADAFAAEREAAAETSPVEEVIIAEVAAVAEAEADAAE